MNSFENEFPELEPETLKLLESKTNQIKASLGMKMHKQNLNIYINSQRYSTG